MDILNEMKWHPLRVWAQQRFKHGFAMAMAVVALWFAVAELNAAHAGPKIEHWMLASGAQVYLVQSHGLPMLDVAVNFDAGTRRDPADKVGLADFVATLADKGVAAGSDAAKEPALDENGVSNAWLDLGALFGASSGRDEFSYRLRTLTYPDVLQPTVTLAARLIAHPTFPEGVLKREQARAVADLQESLTQPGPVAARAYYQAVYSGHPYGAVPTEQTLTAVTVADLKAFHAHYVLPCRARVSMVGDVTREEADAIAQQLLSQLPQSAVCPALPEVPQVPALAHAVDNNIAFQAAQAQILLGQPGIKRLDPDFLVLVVGNHVLGGNGFASRLMQQVREDRGLTYGVSSYFAPGADVGAFTISLKTRPDQAQEALAVVRQVLTGFLRDGPTPQELQAAKANLIGGFPLMFDSNAKLLGQVANIARYDLPLDYLDQWPKLIEAVTAEQIKEAFNRVLNPDKMVTVVLGAQTPAVPGKE